MTTNNKENVSNIGSNLHEVLTSIRDEIVSKASGEAEKIIADAKASAESILREANIEKEKIFTEARNKVDALWSESKQRLATAVQLMIKKLKNKLEASLVKKGLLDHVERLSVDSDAVKQLVAVALDKAEERKLQASELKIVAETAVLEILKPTIDLIREQGNINVIEDAVTPGDSGVKVTISNGELSVALDSNWLRREIRELLHRKAGDVLVNTLSDTIKVDLS